VGSIVDKRQVQIMDYLVDGGCDCARHRLNDQIVAGLARYGCPTIKN